MAIDPKALEAEALKLGLEERARLAEILILSLDAPSEEENLHLWIVEAERRLGELRADKAREIPAEDALRSARAALS
jgi:hypothetical protein